MMELIPVAEFRARNIKENPMTTVYVGYENGLYYYIADNGNIGQKYNSLGVAKEDIKSLWGKWHDFKLLNDELNGT
jgi:hypothetical protein